MTLRILLLHAVGDPAALRRTTLNHAFCLPKYAPGHDYTFHALEHDPSCLEGRTFDAILLDATFLCQRWVRPRELFAAFLERYDFVRRSPAAKIAFPQDDYDHCGVLDRWLHDWGVDAVFSPLARFASVLYPRTSARARILPSLTGYVDAGDVALLSAHARPHEARTIDVGYRARELPPLFGRVGRLKSAIGRLFAERLPAGHGLVLDISTNPADTLLGEAWLRFLGNCKFFVGTASGSSLLDPEGDLKDCVAALAARHPDAGFEAFEASCFPGLDGQYRMTALGPRHLECAVAGVCQILVPDEGLLPLEPGRHYIPMAEDASDIDRVLADMRDGRRVRERIAATYQLLVESPEFGYPGFVARIEACIEEHRPRTAGSGANPLGKEGCEVTVAVPADPAGRESAILAKLLAAELAFRRDEGQRFYRELERLYAVAEDIGIALKGKTAALEEKMASLEQLEAQLRAERAAVQKASAEAAELKVALGLASLAAARRSGVRGALRELGGINAYLEDPAGPARRRLPVLAYRVLQGLRRHGFQGALARVRSRFIRTQAPSPVGDTEAWPAVEPGTVTMLVPDDRIDRRVLLSARSLQQAGWRVTVIAAPYPGPTDGDRAVFPDVQIVRIDTTRAAPRVPLPPEVEAAVGEHASIYFYHGAFLFEAMRHPAEVYVAHDLPVLPAAVLASRAHGSRLAYDAHELYPEQHHFAADLKAAYARAERDLAPLPELVTTVNESIAHEMASRYGIAPPKVIWNAPDADPARLPLDGRQALRRTLGIPPSQRIVLFQGSLSLNRNIEGLVHAMRHVRTPDAVLVVMGPGDEKRAELQAIANAEGLDETRVRFAPPVPQDQLLEYTASADVGVIPYPPIDLNSLYCTPNKLFEYIVAGVPILANDLPELRRFVAGNGFGLVRELSTPVAIAAAIDEILAQDLAPIRARLRERQREFVWAEQGRQLSALYNFAFRQRLEASSIG